MLPFPVITRTTRTPAFWGYSLPPHDYPHYWVILDHKSKEDKVRVTNLKNLPILKQTLHKTHLLKFLDKMCKYEMDLTSIVEDTERTQFYPQMDRRTTWNRYTPPSTLLKRGNNNPIFWGWRFLIHKKCLKLNLEKLRFNHRRLYLDNWNTISLKIYRESC